MNKGTYTESGSSLNSLEFFIKAYSYTAEDNRLVMDHELLIRICGGKDLSFNRIFWTEEKFAAVPEAVSKEIAGVICENGEKRKEFSVTFNPPKEPYHDFWHLGVGLYPGGKIRFAIGNKEVYSLTGEIDLNLL